jgi:hypothetical protein
LTSRQTKDEDLAHDLSSRAGFSSLSIRKIKKGLVVMTMCLTQLRQWQTRHSSDLDGVLLWLGLAWHAFVGYQVAQLFRGGSVGLVTIVGILGVLVGVIIMLYGAAAFYYDTIWLLWHQDEKLPEWMPLLLRQHYLYELFFVEFMALIVLIIPAFIVRIVIDEKKWRRQESRENQQTEQ